MESGDVGKKERCFMVLMVTELVRQVGASS